MAQVRVGLDGGRLASLLTTRVEKVGLPSTSNNLRVVRTLGCPVPTESYVGLLEVSPEGIRAEIVLLGHTSGAPNPGTASRIEIARVDGRVRSA